MLGLLITYHSFFEMLPFQIKNIQHFVKVPHKILVVDDSDLEVSPLAKICEEFDTLYWKIPPSQHKLFGEHPSARHQHALNLGLELLRDSCSHILLFDNDMIFMNDFKPALDKLVWYVPDRRGTLVYPWLNLFLFSTSEKIIEFEFATCLTTGETTDPGGNLAEFLIQRTLDCRPIIHQWKSDVYLVGWQTKFRKLCETYQIQPWYDIFHIEETPVFHFRGLSNWQKHPVEFLEAKKTLILDALTEFQSTYVPDNH
jgi:hypothetical protein